MGKLKVEPGIYSEVPFEQYLEWDALSNSLMKAMSVSPAHCKAAMSGASYKVTDALRLGSAMHAALFEPELFEKEYVVLPVINRRTKAGREEYQEYINKYGEDKLLKHEEFEKVQRVVEAVVYHAIAGPLVEAIDDAEVSVAFPYRDVLCKSRFDSLNFRDAAIIDLKTTQSAKPELFQKSMFKYGYHRQAYLYLQAAQEFGIAIKRFLFIAVEKEAPFGVSVHECSEEVLKLARREVDEAVDKYRYCTQHNKWPGYEREVHRVQLPEWAGFIEEGEPK